MNIINDTFIAPHCNGEIEVLFQDEDLLLIFKPSGLLSLSGKNPLNKDSVHFRLVKGFPDVTLAHRLDFGTSLYGHIENDHGVINLPIAKDSAIFPRLKICEETGKPALTHYLVEDRLHYPPRSIVRFRPETGRTHQLRIHVQAIGHTILGCDLYGDENTHSLAARLMLHAESLDFIHPTSGEKIHAVCPCPF